MVSGNRLSYHVMILASSWQRACELLRDSRLKSKLSLLEDTGFDSIQICFNARRERGSS